MKQGFRSDGTINKALAHLTSVQQLLSAVSSMHSELFVQCVSPTLFSASTMED